MNETNSEMTRRDWFRLRSTQPNRSLGAQGGKGTENPDLAPIDLPPNHHGMDLSELPPMREAMLTVDQVSLLFGDIDRFAQEVQLFQRARQARARATFSSQNDLALAKQALLSGKVSRVQIRYRWQDSHWIDTLERREEGTRLVRIAHLQTPG